MELHPLELLDATYDQPSGQPAAVTLSFALTGISLADWAPRSLRLFLAGEYSLAADLYFLLRRHLRRILLTPLDGGRPVVLPPDCLQPVGFSDGESLIPYPAQAYPGYRLLQEYITAPERFLLLDLVGWERWVERGNGSRFTVTFELRPPRCRRHG